MGHLICAQEAHARLSLDSVLFMPVGEAPHREVEQDPGGEVRARLCERAVDGDPRFEVSRAEIERPGPSFTADTLSLLSAASPEDDLVLILDESHRYRASAGVRAINELKPILGLELTATPFVEGAKGSVPFKNVIYDYSLGKAMADGFIKDPAVVTQKDFDPRQFSAERLEQIKLEDGIRLHESVKVELETYARQNDKAIVKPFVLVIARDTTHAGQLLQWIQSEKFFETLSRQGNPG